MDPSRSSRINQRFTEVDPPSNDAPSSDEYLREPLVSLESALHHLLSDISQLDKYIEYAKKNCNRSSTYGLTHDESAAIYLYTIEWDGGNSQSLYFMFNNALRSGNRSEKKRWSPYLKLLVTALMKFPSIEISVWRNLKEDVSKNYPKDKRFTWPNVTSCSRNVNEVIQCFWNLNGQNTLFNISVINGKDISAYSQYAREQEVVLLPGTRFRVTGGSVLEKAGNCKNIPVIHLQEIKF
jgi:hypothetical protein